MDLWNPIRKGTGVWKRNEIVYIRRADPSCAAWISHPQAAIRIGDWKLIGINHGFMFDKHKVNKNELYNLAKDPKEKVIIFT